MPSIQTYLSPAKVNLFLRVLRKRADGYHDIMSLMQPISLYDEISLDIREGRGISIECDNISIPVDRTNLAFKAAEAFFKTTGINNKAIIKIKKRNLLIVAAFLILAVLIPLIYAQTGGNVVRKRWINQKEEKILTHQKEIILQAKDEAFEIKEKAKQEEDTADVISL